MNRQEERRKDYGSPRTRMVQVEMEEGVCASAASNTGTPVIREENQKVQISEQGHGGWNGSGDDISVTWGE